MKRSILFLSVLLLSCGAALGQKAYKFAHVESQELIAAMPERDSAMTKLKAFEQELMEQMDQLQVEMNKKYQEYLQKRETLSPSMRDAKEKEINDLQQRLQEYQVAAQRDFQDMQGKLMKPIVDKAHEAIQKVAKANGYIYVFDKSAGSLLYVSEDSVDILEMVKKELGIKTK